MKHILIILSFSLLGLKYNSIHCKDLFYLNPINSVDGIDIKEKNLEKSNNNVGDNAFNKIQLFEISAFDNEEIEIRVGLKYGNYKIIIGNYFDENIDEENPESYGLRLFLFDKNDNIKYKSKGMGEVFGMEPYFYVSNDKSQLVIACNLSLEEDYIGVKLFLLEKGNIKELGNINYASGVEGKSMAENLHIERKSSNEFQITVPNLPYICELSEENPFLDKIDNWGLTWYYKNGEFGLKEPNIK